MQQCHHTANAYIQAMQDKYIHMHGDFELVPRLITTALNPALGTYTYKNHPTPHRASSY